MRSLKRLAALSGIVYYSSTSSLAAQDPNWVLTNGNVQLADGTPVCAMVLANGQYMFSCDGTGAFDLGAPLDANGQITLLSFADGFAPFSATLGPENLPFTVFMETAPPDSQSIAMSRETSCATRSWVRVMGDIRASSGEPLCAMVLANGEQMFTCGDQLGHYDLMVPADENGNVTVFAFADGFTPHKETFGVPSCDARFDMLDLVNNARSRGWLCGGEGYFPPAESLQWNDLLADAARSHSSDMSAQDFFSHTGSDGGAVADRVNDTGYDWWTIGENIAAGYTTAQAATQALLDSPGHCANIMNPDFAEFGAARSDDPDSYYDVYWTQVFGASW